VEALRTAGGARDTKEDEKPVVDVLPKPDAYSIDDDAASTRQTAPPCIRILLSIVILGWVGLVSVCSFT